MTGSVPATAVIVTFARGFIPWAFAYSGDATSTAEAPSTTPEELRNAIDAMQPDDRLIPGLAPHTPYTVTRQHLRACFDLARKRSLPITLHLADKERFEFLRVA